MGKKDTNHYVVLDPAGRQYCIEDIADFCQEHDLWPSNMRKVAQGRAKNCKGWSCRYAEKDKQAIMMKIRTKSTNEKQKAILKVITDLAKHDVINSKKFGDDLYYGFRNYVRRYSLANDNYFISISALKYLKARNFKSPFTRSWKAGKFKIKYEHPVPAKVICKEISRHINTAQMIERILEWTDCVTIITPEEDQKLAGPLRANMPEGWQFFEGDVFHRYLETGIRLSEEKIPMTGAIAV